MFQEKEKTMALDILNRPAPLPRLTPVAPRYAPLFCFVLLTIACGLASFAFACATPFAAFAVIAAAMLPLPSALLTVAAAWLVNQGIGFGCLHYPINGSTIAWGFVIGAAALAATGIAAAMLRSPPRSGTAVALASALLGAYAAYEIVLFLATPVLGGEGDFTAAIVGRIGILNVLWLIGLVAASEASRLIMAGRRRQTVA
jgi:hypothetical protein